VRGRARDKEGGKRASASTTFEPEDEVVVLVRGRRGTIRRTMCEPDRTHKEWLNNPMLEIATRPQIVLPRSGLKIADRIVGLRTADKH